VWSRVLVYVYVKSGTRSETWQSLMETLDTLLWSLQPLSSGDDLGRRQSLLGDLEQRLRDAMELVQLAAGEIEHWLGELRILFAEIDRNDRRYLADAQPPRPIETAAPLEAIVLTSVQELEDDWDGPAPDSEHVAAVDGLEPGTWVEFQQEQGMPLRCKLTAVIQPGARYVFVDRRGMKVAEKSRLALAFALGEGRARVLDDAQMFDRALETVIGNLRQLQSSSSIRPAV
jgi:hypothetical protein